MKKLQNLIIIWVFTILLVTFTSLLTYIVAQQVIRLGANNLPATLARETSIKLEKGQSPSDSIPGQSIDISKSLDTFVMIYDRDKNLSASSALMGEQQPAYPRGVLDFVEKIGEERVTWQPVAGPPRQSNHRFATVAIKSGDYYIVAGRSLAESEKLVGEIGKLILAAWVACLFFLTAVLGIFYIFIKKVYRGTNQ